MYNVDVMSDFFFFFFKQKTAYEIYQCDWSSDVCSSDLGRTLGADQGLNEILTLSDGQTTNTSMAEILAAIARKRRGSQAQRRKITQRDNLIREQLNNLDFSGVGKVNLEQVKDLRKGKRTSAILTHWNYALIENKMRDLSETEGFVLQMNSSAYRSQRCSGCGVVRKSNRTGKQYACACGTCMDADLNAAKNHEIDLPQIPFDFREKNQIIQLLLE